MRLVVARCAKLACTKRKLKMSEVCTSAASWNTLRRRSTMYTSTLTSGDIKQDLIQLSD